MDAVHERLSAAQCGSRFFSLSVLVFFFNHMGFCHHKIRMASFLSSLICFKKKKRNTSFCGYLLLLVNFINASITHLQTGKDLNNLTTSTALLFLWILTNTHKSK